MSAKVRQIAPPMVERFYTPQEIAAILQMHPDVVRRHFHTEPGVAIFRTGRLKKHALLRIPQSVLDRWIRENQVA